MNDWRSYGDLQVGDTYPAEPARFHVHTIVRAPNGNDYGRDLLAQHYRRHHSG